MPLVEDLFCIFGDEPVKMPNWGGGPINDSCHGYCGNECPSFVVPYVGGLINGVLGGY